MPLHVLKYGGSSLATPEKVWRVAETLARLRSGGDSVVVVVSAQGDTTDRLLEQVHEISSAPSPRELARFLATGETQSASLMAVALGALGVDAVSLSGGQAGIRTDDRPINATILEVIPDRIREELARGRVVVVTGFQGVDPRGEITTLGRGGSDTTAVALAHGLGVGHCHIFTDVDGVYTSDPRVVREPRRVERVGYREMLELARLGAQVLHSQAVELARKHRVRISVRSASSDDWETVVADDDALGRIDAPDGSLSVDGAGGAGGSDGPGGFVTGVACLKEVLAVRIAEPMNGQPVRGDLFPSLAAHEILHCRRTTDGLPEWMFLNGENRAPFEGFVDQLRDHHRATVSVRQDLGAISAVGPYLGLDTGALERGRRAIEEAGVEVVDGFADTDSVTCLVDSARADEALRIFHRTFCEELPRC